MINRISVMLIEIPKNLMRIKTPAAIARTEIMIVSILAKSPEKISFTAVRISLNHTASRAKCK